MKKLTMVLAVGALTLSMAGIGSATDINIYGASAQLNFWAGLASAYLKDAAGANCSGAVSCYPLDSGGGCTLGDKTYAPADTPVTGPFYHGAKYFIASANGCALGGGTVTIRVGAYDSADGIQSVLGNTNIIDVKGCLGNQRTQLNSTTNNVLACYPTILGSADVDGKTIVQQTEGQLDGPSGPPAGTLVAGGTVDLGDFNAPGDAYGGVYTPVDTTSSNSLVTDYHPVIVPFGFFANKSLQASNPAYPSGLTNLTTAQVQQLFSGAATNWSQFGFPAQAVVLCMRVAGSGTYATFDAGVMKSNGFSPASLPIADKSVVGNNVWFNNTSGDMMNCINTNAGAIGFADADQSLSSYGNAYAIAFNGVMPSATTIKNGAYDRFWSLEHIFELKTLASSDPTTHAVVSNMTTWAASHIPASKTNFWINSNTTNWYKPNDYYYPPLKGAYGAGEY